MSTTTREARAQKLTDLGFMLFGEGRWEEAATAFRTAAVANPDDEDAWLGLGSALVRQERFEDAAIVLGTAAAIARSSGAWPTLLAVEALLGSGDVRRAQQAMAWFDALEASGGVDEEQRTMARSVRATLEKAS